MRPEHAQLLAKVARLYYERGMRQQQIADLLNLSQARVSRLLKEAEQAGIVRSVVVLPDGVHTDVEEAVQQRFGLRDVVVADTGGAGDDVTSALGGAAAAYLDATLKGGDVVGLSSWSGSLLAAVQSMRAKPQPVADRVIQLFGGVGRPEAQTQATRMIERLSQITGAAPVIVPTPGVVGSPEIQRAMMSDPSVQAVSEQWADVTVSLVGIGSLEPSPLLQHSGNVFSDADQQELREAGAVGDICLRFFDAGGEDIHSAFDDRVVGIDADALRAIPRRVAIAGGPAKGSAIRAALSGGWVNVLITDVDTARMLIA